MMAETSAQQDAPADATELARLIRTGQISAAEAVEAAIARAEALQPKLNFLVNSSFDLARERAKAADLGGPFAGVPFLIKDLDDVIGVPTCNGSQSSRDAKPATSQEANIYAYERAGLISIGKSTTPEYGFLPTTEPVAFGPTRNPWNPERSSGGSSGGAAAAVAAGVVPFAHASDGGGSIRIPAANCGLFGLKTTRGRLIPGRPSPRRIQVSVQHCVSRSVRDSAALFAASERTDADAAFSPLGMIAGPSARRLRVGVLTRTLIGAAPDPEVQDAVDGAVRLLEQLGHHVEPAAWPVDGRAFSQDFLVLWASGAAELVEQVGKAIGRKVDETVLEPFTLAMAQAVDALPAGGLDQAVDNLNAATAAYQAWFDRFDVIVSPVLGKPPAPLGWVAPTVPIDELTERLNAYVGYTTLHNVVGAPAMSVPLHWTADGLPVGVQVAGAVGDERTLFELAYELEQAQPWAWRRPPIWAD